MQEAPIHYNTISQVASLIEAKELSPVELTEAMLLGSMRWTAAT